MKTAISVSDETYDRAERVAKKHGLNRSQFYSAAAERYADILESSDLTAAINSVADVANSDGSTQFAATVAARATADDEW